MKMSSHSNRTNKGAKKKRASCFKKNYLGFFICRCLFRCVDAKNFGAALTLTTKASELTENGEVFDRRASAELKAFVHDSFAYFYFKRGKHEAALHYAAKAMKVHAAMKDWAHVAKVHLHSACILAKLSRKDEAIRCNAQVII